MGGPLPAERGEGDLSLGVAKVQRFLPKLISRAPRAFLPALFQAFLHALPPPAPGLSKVTLAPLGGERAGVRGGATERPAATRCKERRQATEERQPLAGGGLGFAGERRASARARRLQRDRA